VGRDPNTIGRGVILAHRSVIKEARSFLACEFVVSTAEAI
jgi:hypothetical protein